MRLMYLILLLLIPVFSLGQDTVFLRKPNNIGCSVFIDTNKASVHYNAISKFTFNQYDSISYYETYQCTLDSLLSHKTIDSKTLGVPLQWVRLVMYKGKYYTYHPSDFYAEYKVGITDSTFIEYTGEGAFANLIKNFYKIDDNTFKFALSGLYYRPNTRIIHIIDHANGIAVFEDLRNNSSNNEKVLYLMINANKIRNFPIIVNWCENMKQVEFYDFDEIDLSGFLKK